MTPLPPNSTHLLQPLDVSFFAPMKRKWRAVLDNWRKESRRKGTIPKEQFPVLLNKLWGSVSTTAKANLISGFRTTGICPFSPDTILSKLPDFHDSSSTSRMLDESLLDFLKGSRGAQTDESASRKRGKKLKTRPGERMCLPPVENLPADSISSDMDNLPLSVVKKTVQDYVNSQPGPSKPQPSTTTQSKAEKSSDDLCAICKCLYSKYRGPDWICCVICFRWICGICNKASKENQYMCPICEDDN